MATLSILAACAGSEPKLSFGGNFGAIPVAAPEQAYFAQGLGGLLLGDAEFNHRKITGRLESVELALLSDRRMQVRIKDCAGNLVIEREIDVVAQDQQGKTWVSWEKPTIEMQHEGRRTLVSSKHRMCVTPEGRLRIEMNATYIRVGLFGRGKPYSGNSWLEFPRRE